MKPWTKYGIVFSSLLFILQTFAAPLIDITKAQITVEHVVFHAKLWLVLGFVVTYLKKREMGKNEANNKKTMDI